MDLKNVTIVVCTKNSQQLLGECLSYIKKETPECELIVVDADSTDKAIEISKKHVDKVVSDQKRGLSYARQLGIDTAKNSLVAFVGVDNNVPRQTFVELIKEIESDEKLAGVQPITVLGETKNYWEWATKNIFELILSNTGYVDVIGTPCIFKKPIVSVIRYEEDIKGGADDTALCLKLIKAGYKLKRINVGAFEKQDLNFKSFFDRWKFYGKGDNDFYKKYQNSWSLKRKIRSLTHPLVKYTLKGLLTAVKKNKIALIPALLVATFARYYGWIRAAE